MRFDIAILGGGPSACALAIRASLGGMRVAVISRLGAKRYAKTPETLPGTAKIHFEELGLASRSSDFIVRRQYLMFSAWGTGHLSTRSSIYDAAGPGFFINRVNFDAVILDAARTSGDVTEINGTVRELKREKDLWTVGLHPTSKYLTADFVIDASGRHSSLARLLGIRRLTIDRQVCVEVQATTKDEAKALVESTADGWWFSAPIENNRAGISWFTDPIGVRGALRSDATFGRSLGLAEHTARGIESFSCADRVVRTSDTSFLSRFGGEGWLPIGDAAIAPDPLSSQGVFAALESSRVAFDSVVSYLSGRGHGIQQYTEYQRSAVMRLVRDRQKIYAMERRWKQSTFWQRRSLSVPIYAV